MNSIQTKLTQLGACRRAIAWAGQFDSEQSAWDQCQRADDMLWYIKRLAGPIGSDSHRKFTLAKARIATTVLAIFEKQYPNDTRPRQAIEIALQYGRGDVSVTEKELENAAATAAAYAAHAAAYADAAAAYAAHAAAYAAATAAAAADAHAAHAAAYADAAADDITYTNALTKFADMIRELYPAPPGV